MYICNLEICIHMYITIFSQKKEPFERFYDVMPRNLDVGDPQKNIF